MRYQIWGTYGKPETHYIPQCAACGEYLRSSPAYDGQTGLCWRKRCIRARLRPSAGHEPEPSDARRASQLAKMALAGAACLVTFASLVGCPMRGPEPHITERVAPWKGVVDANTDGMFVQEESVRPKFPLPAETNEPEVCAALASAGCSEGRAASCPQDLREAKSQHLTVNDACLLGAKNAESVRGCARVGDLPIRCIP